MWALQINVTQDSVGGHSLTIPWAATAFGVAVEINTEPNSKTALSLQWDGDALNVFVGAEMLGFPAEWVI